MRPIGRKIICHRSFCNSTSGTGLCLPSCERKHQQPCSRGNVSIIGRIFSRTAERKCVLAIQSACPSVSRKSSASKTRAGNAFNLISPRYAHHDQPAVGCKTGHEAAPIAPPLVPVARIALARPYAAAPRQHLAASSMVTCRAQIICKLSFSRPRPIATVRNPMCRAKLDTEMPKSTNALHGDQISTGANRRSEGRVSRNTAQRKRGGLADVSSSGTDETARASAIITSAYLHPRLLPMSRGSDIHDVSSSTRFAYAVFSGMRPDATRWPIFHLDHTPARASMRPTTSCPGTRGRVQTG